MAHTLDLSSARLQAGAVHGGALGDALRNLDFSRIAAESGAIAVHVAALMLLLAPMSVPSMPVAEEQFPPFIIDPIKAPPPPPPPPPIEVPVRTASQTPTPVVQPAHVEPPPITVVDATAVDLPPVTESLVEATHEPGDSIAPPLAGAHLEYEIAPPPRYTSEMMRAGLEGTVLLRVLVDVDGTPLEVSIERSSGHRELDQLARRQVQGKWRFRPAMQDGRATQAIGLVPVNFTLGQ